MEDRIKKHMDQAHPKLPQLLEEGEIVAYEEEELYNLQQKFLFQVDENRRSMMNSN